MAFQSRNWLGTRLEKEGGAVAKSSYPISDSGGRAVTSPLPAENPVTQLGKVAAVGS